MAVRPTIRTPMPVKMRAKQFMMFDAMKGLTEAIADKEASYSSRKELSESRIEEINQQLIELEVGAKVSVMYYCWYGRQYREIYGIVSKIDGYWRMIQICDVSIGFDEIYAINDYI